eukprot:XP_019926544.1 PREDICTED: tripartite motif-containing protein 2-like [Crassostrea gigas]
MDDCTSTLDETRCEICKSAKVQSYCDFCHVNLCNPCTGEHILDKYDKHKVVPFHRRQSSLIFPKCSIHQNRTCKFQCKNCIFFVCSFCIASKEHGEHDLIELTKVYETKKENIVKDTYDLENVLKPTYCELALDLENKIANLNVFYENIATTILEHGEEWHKEIDNLISKLNSEIASMKSNHLEILQKELCDIIETKSSIERTAESLKKIQESSEISQIIEYSYDNKEFSQLPSLVNVLLPTFSPKPIEQDKLHNCFGDITQLSVEETASSPVESSTSEEVLLHDFELVDTIKSGYDRIHSVSYENEEKLWMSGQTGEIKCYTMEGVLLREIKTELNVVPDNIIVDSFSVLMYSDPRTYTVYKVENDKSVAVIEVQEWIPSYLCVTATPGNLLVTMYRYDRTEAKVVRYSGSIENQTIQFNEEGKALYSLNDKVKYITENRNQDICVADFGAKAVVVVNHDGKFRFRFTRHRSASRSRRFTPSGIATDSHGRILTSDYNNHCIHIIDQNGQFLSCIDNCDLEFPCGLCVNNEGDLFVCEHKRGNVKKIKYS